jgi:hypothetical protein
MGHSRWEINSGALTDVKPVNFTISAVSKSGMWVDCADPLCMWQEYVEGVISVGNVLMLIANHTYEHNDLVTRRDLQESLDQIRRGEVVEVDPAELRDRVINEMRARGEDEK